MIEPIEPGDLNGLRDEGLAAAGEYMTLAALALRQGGEPALVQLAGRCDEVDAFAWWWSLVGQDGQRFASVRHMPERITVPDALYDAVGRHLLAPSTPQELQRPSPVSFSRSELLWRLDPADMRVLAIARTALAQPAQLSAGVVEAALHTMGASVEQADRAAVIDHAATVDYAQRAQVFLQLAEPFSEEEAHQIATLLGDMKSRGADRPQWEPVAHLLRRLPTDVAADFLGRPFPHGTGRTTLFDAGLIQHLSRERLQDVLEVFDAPPVVNEFLGRAAIDISEHELPDFAPWAHARFDVEECAPLRQRLADVLRRQYGSNEHRERAKDALWACALAGRGSAAVAAELIAVLGVEEIAAQAAEVDAEGAAGQLGIVAARLLAAADEQPGTGGEPDEQRAIDAVAAAAAALSADLRPAFYADLAHTGISTSAMPMMRDAVLDGALADDASITAFASNGGADALTEHASCTSAHAARMLLAAADHLTAAQATALLGLTRSPDPKRGENDELDRSGVDWTTTDGDTYAEIIETITRWPDALLAAVDRAIAALDEPELRHPTPRVLVALLGQAERGGLVEDFGEPATTDHVRRLLTKQRDPEVLAAACRWIRRLDIDRETADPGRSRLVLDADDARAKRQQDLHRLRLDLADRHAELAKDTGLDGERRVAHLQMATELHHPTARTTALQLSASPTTEVRLAAAGVLADTPGAPEEHEAISTLIAAEDDAEIGKRLQAALHRLTSGDVGEAIRNLAELLDLPAGGLDPDVLIPDDRHRDRFAVWTDKARARADDAADPGAFIEAAINVADQQVDLAIIARQHAGKRLLKPDQIEALRTNAPNRLDIGALVTQQQLVATFGWFPVVATLREKRAAHPSRTGTTEPLRIRPEDLVVAKSLLRTITDGWIRDMHASAQLAGQQPEN